MRRHQRRTTRGPVSDVALRGRFKGLALDTAMLALLTNASVFCDASREVECRLMNEVEVRQAMNIIWSSWAARSPSMTLDTMIIGDCLRYPLSAARGIDLRGWRPIRPLYYRHGLKTALLWKLKYRTRRPRDRRKI
jgi:hypothetical protein